MQRSKELLIYLLKDHREVTATCAFILGNRSEDICTYMYILRETNEGSVDPCGQEPFISGISCPGVSS